jgi:hypothetical protein
MPDNHVKAPTQHVEVNSARNAYPRWRKLNTVPGFLWIGLQDAIIWEIIFPIHK